MQAFVLHTGIAAPLLRPNIDTDAIIPSREMKQVSKRGLDVGLFAAWRYSDVDARTPNPDFVLNQNAYAGCSVLLGGANFGCGSSREHAVWALVEYGIRAIIAPSFGAIFQQNCVRNGLLPIVLDAEAVEALAARIQTDPRALPLTIDLEQQHMTLPDGGRWLFDIDATHREMLLKGLDPIALTLTQEAHITAFEALQRKHRPWLYSPLQTSAV